MSASASRPPRSLALRALAPLPALLAAAWLLAPSPALSQQMGRLPDVQNLEPQLPVEIEDAELTGAGQRELQLPLRMTREQDGDDRFLIEPRFQFGLAERWQATVGLPLVIGSSDRTNSGNLRGDMLFKPIDEGSLIPAIAVGAGLELPTGKNAEGTDLTLRLLATKTLGAVPGTHRIHGNASWRINDDALPGERDDTVRFGLGYSTPLSDATLLVADVMRGHGRLGATGMSTVWELGVRQVFTPGTIVAVGLGVGSGPDAPDWQVTAGVETRF
ncbi:MAG: hypothetical protein EHM87_01510 [Burkholderiales bacterium]|nr:MAG: hypothetical protein EHM87_01510 [Burkholderiales bacterium]